MALSMTAQAAELDIHITNLTGGLYFTPVLLAAADGNTHLYQTGETASTELQAMAEGGDISGLAVLVEAAGGVKVENPAAGLLAPGASANNIMLDTGSNTHLSLTAMILPTNDGFVGLNNWQVPTMAGTYTIYLDAYDAGTEANDEIINGGGTPGAAGIPAAPGADGGMNGSGLSSTQSNTKVHIHPGNIGDMDAEGGKSDLDSRIHRWLNPVAKLTVTVK
nr:spondin domain-containing protein [Psychromonas ossibalaenae]